MFRKESPVQKIARLTSNQFPSLSTSGTNVDQLIRFVLAKRSALESAKRKKADPGNDARDVSMTSGLLKTLSNKALGEIADLGRSDIHRRLQEKTYPFSRLNKKTRETLLYLPNSWVRDGAVWQLNLRKQYVAN
ncbi:MAG: hypothetical protein A3J47_03755 [Candidatus Yanofskybacteria bacterium RIFCSPHIGHO2_02_FULL_43_22]|uniref:Uncharacterized protein n=1 Tax=Candidatus Yanofskybacteria bacterium RIFCSPHIGHO2_02_FULL_43_22 TaxID=1802681 RepID=A0A1F8FNC3_9BACT|nr:MAG: hypothetical protein A3J47_03755 [Candidatus Yanofskybacteria bacterium RIFCSPHIGHO2_02_FULL_43_22]